MLNAYEGIVRCNRNFTAVIKRGYWAGYHGNQLYTAPCPLQFCVTNTFASSEHSLAILSDALSLFMCGTTRHGVLCGTCKKGYSIYYHSQLFSCGSNEKCQYGAILYILSEILPVFIFFTVIVTFDISFSVGSRNGFIFFSQMVTILPLEYFMTSQSPVAEYL